MLIDTQQVSAGQVVHSDLCLVGAGAAGITIARKLSATGLDVCVLEAGGLDLDLDVQDLYAGPADGTALPADSAYLTRSRLRYFGGSTNHWTGYCRPLDDIDFTVRPWVPNSGWPFPKSALEAYYEAAAGILQVPVFDGSQDEGVGWDADTVLTADTAFLTKQFHLSPPTRFARRNRAELVASSNVSVYLNANVIGIDTNEAGTRVDRLRVSTLSGKQIEVRSSGYVLAAGGVENARLLLMSDSVHPKGVGNDHDLVGRYFMEHPHVSDAGEVVLTRALSDPLTYSRRGALRAVLCPSEALQRTHQLLNCSLMLNFNMARDAAPGVRRVWQVLSYFERLDEIAPPGGPPWSGCYVRAEQAPDAESRVTLADERDALGMRRAQLHWRMQRIDIESIRRTIELLGLELGRTGRGRVRHNIDPLAQWAKVGGGDHHMGTTRMSDLPTQGVVDRNCQVHGVGNLFVAGSSVFPTVGFANPTMTLVALALRLADHVGSELRNV